MNTTSSNLKQRDTPVIARIGIQSKAMTKPLVRCLPALQIGFAATMIGFVQTACRDEGPQARTAPRAAPTQASLVDEHQSVWSQTRLWVQTTAILAVFGDREAADAEATTGDLMRALSELQTRMGREGDAHILRYLLDFTEHATEPIRDDILMEDGIRIPPDAAILLDAHQAVAAMQARGIVPVAPGLLTTRDDAADIIRHHPIYQEWATTYKEKGQVDVSIGSTPWVRRGFRVWKVTPGYKEGSRTIGWDPRVYVTIHGGHVVTDSVWGVMPVNGQPEAIKLNQERLLCKSAILRGVRGAEETYLERGAAISSLRTEEFSVPSDGLPIALDAYHPAVLSLAYQRLQHEKMFAVIERHYRAAADILKLGNQTGPGGTYR